MSPPFRDTLSSAPASAAQEPTIEVAVPFLVARRTRVSARRVLSTETNESVTDTEDSSPQSNRAPLLVALALPL